VKREDLLQQLKTEIQFLMMIDHPNVVKLVEVLASKTKIYLVLEYIEGGELWDKICSFDTLSINPI
jgi:5'-AMP-activated protein kinase catalytic alpha subunit